MNSKPHRILVVGPSWVGDMIMAQSLFITLKRRSPACEIDVVAPAWSSLLASRMPEVSRAITMPVGHRKLHLLTRYRIGKQQRAMGYAQAIILPRTFKSALVPWFARIPRRTGYRGEMRYGLINDMRPLDKSVLIQTVQRYVALGLDPGAELPPPIPQPRLMVDEENVRAQMQRLGLGDDRPVIGIMPGAEYGPAKQWPPEYYTQLIRRLVDDGLQVWLFGSQRDRGVAASIAELALRPVRNLCGLTGLDDAVDLIAQTRMVVTNDSGLMHVAAAVGRPLVAIYGFSTPAYTPPLSDQARVMYLGLECSPCFERVCPLGHTRCLKDLSVDRIYREVGMLLDMPTEHTT